MNESCLTTCVTVSVAVFRAYGIASTVVYMLTQNRLILNQQQKKICCVSLQRLKFDFENIHAFETKLNNNISIRQERIKHFSIEFGYFSTEFLLRTFIKKAKDIRSTMVSQVICVICSIVPEPHTTDITFYKIPKAIEMPTLFKSWKTAMVDALSDERPELLDDASLHDTYVCSRHFTINDFSFENGKLCLVDNAIPSLLKKSQYENCDSKQSTRFTKEYEPSSRCDNFATTLTKDFVTTSRHNLRSDFICTETSRVLTPTVSVYLPTPKRNIDDILSKNIQGSMDDGVDVSKKRNIDVQHKVEVFEKIFKRMHCDNILTDAYVEKLKVK